MPLLLQGFVLEAQTLYGSEHYTRALCDIAETGGAFGEMATLLLRGQESQKSTVAISIPFVIKSHEKLRILLKYHNGLELIYREVEDSKNSMYDDAILSICKLADSLKVSTPKGPSGEEENEKVENCVAEPKDEDFHGDEEKSRQDLVIFQLDDGSTVETKRKEICQKSEVFAAMLEGNFSESGQNSVRLKKASKAGLSTLLDAANGDCRLKNHQIEAILDAVILADKFLMADLSERLTELSMARLDHENLCRAWNWSRINSCHEFRNCCVKIFLTSEMMRSHRLQAFRDFHETTNFRDFVKDTRNVIENALALPRT